MAYDKKWLVKLLRRLGYEKEADEAARALPDKVSQEQLEEFTGQFGIDRDELIDRMGGSP